jgi:hypothetical protein
MINKNQRGKLSKIKQKIKHLEKSRNVYIRKLLKPMPMIVGSLYEVYKACNKPNCCCAKGRKHGPFWALSISVAAKRRVKMVKKDDLTAVRQKALSFQKYQQTLAKIRKINKEIDVLLEQIKKAFLEEYN